MYAEWGGTALQRARGVRGMSLERVLLDGRRRRTGVWRRVAMEGVAMEGRPWLHCLNFGAGEN